MMKKNAEDIPAGLPFGPGDNVTLRTGPDLLEPMDNLCCSRKKLHNNRNIALIGDKPFFCGRHCFVFRREHVLVEVLGDVERLCNKDPVVHTIFFPG